MSWYDIFPYMVWTKCLLDCSDRIYHPNIGYTFMACKNALEGLALVFSEAT